MGFDIYKSCKGCPYRCPEPNCHDTCPGHKARCEENEIKRMQRRRDSEFTEYKIGAVEYTKKNLKNNSLKRFSKGLKK